MGRYETALYELSTSDTCQIDKYKLRELCYGLTQELPCGPWKNPEFIAKGGHSVVIVAYSQFFEQNLAIKFCLPVREKEVLKKHAVFKLFVREGKEKLSMKEEFEQRFKRGAKYQKWLYDVAKSQSLFKYAYIPEVFSQPQDNAKLQYAMEYCPGENIVFWSKKQSAYSVIFEVYRNVLEFVNLCFHKYGAIHRDLKPDNILVSPTNTPIIIDFGLVKILSKENEDVTHSTTVLGNEKWMSPRQRFSAKFTSWQDDIYTLGLLFWSMVNKTIPVMPPGKKRDDVSTWEIFPPAELPSSVDCFRDFFEKMSSDFPEQRYPTLTHAISGFDQALAEWTNSKKTTIINKTEIKTNKIICPDLSEIQGQYSEVTKKLIEGLFELLDE